MQSRTPCQPLFPDQNSGKFMVADRKNKLGSKKKCHAFEKGDCKYNPCRFSHVECEEFNRGYCRNRACRYVHIARSGLESKGHEKVAVKPIEQNEVLQLSAENTPSGVTACDAKPGASPPKPVVNDRTFTVQCENCLVLFSQDLTTVEAFSSRCGECKSGRPPPMVVMTDTTALLDHQKFTIITAPKVDWRAENGVRPETRAFGLNNYLRRVIAGSLSVFGETSDSIAEAGTEMWRVWVPEDCYSSVLDDIQRQTFAKSGRIAARARAARQSANMYFQRYAKDKNHVDTWQRAARHMDPTMTLSSYRFEVAAALSFFMVRTWPRKQAAYAHNLYANMREIEHLDRFVHDGDTFTVTQCATSVASGFCQGLCLTAGAIGLGLGLCGVAVCDVADQCYPGGCGDIADTAFTTLTSCAPQLATTLAKARPFKRRRDVEFEGYARQVRRRIVDCVSGAPSIGSISAGVTSLSNQLSRVLRNGYTVIRDDPDPWSVEMPSYMPGKSQSDMDGANEEFDDSKMDDQLSDFAPVAITDSLPAFAPVAITDSLPAFAPVAITGNQRHASLESKDSDMAFNVSQLGCPESEAGLHWLTPGPVPDLPIDALVEPSGSITSSMCQDYRSRSGEARESKAFEFYAAEDKVHYQFGVLCGLEMPVDAKIKGDWNLKAFVAPEYAASCVHRSRNEVSRLRRKTEFELSPVLTGTGAKRWFHTGLLLWDHPVFGYAPVDENLVFTIKRHYGVYPHQCDCKTVDNYMTNLDCRECQLWKGFADCTPWLEDNVVAGAVNYALAESEKHQTRDRKLFSDEELLQFVKEAKQLPRPILAIDDSFGFQSWYCQLDARRRRVYADGLSHMLEGKFFNPKSFDMTIFMKWEKASNLVIGGKSKLLKACRGVCPSKDATANAASGPPFRGVSKGLTFATRKWLSNPEGFPPEVMVTSGSTPLEIGLLHDTIVREGYACFEFDMSCFDSTQGRLVRKVVDDMMFGVIRSACGSDGRIMEILQKSFSERKVVTAIGDFTYKYGWCSGNGATFQGNTFASVRAVLGAARLTLKEMQSEADTKFMVLGDDSVLYLRGLPRTRWSSFLSSVVEKLMLIGLKPEPVTSCIPSFCSALFWPIKHHGRETTILAPELLRFLSRVGASFNWVKPIMAVDEARAINKGLALSNPHWVGLPVLRIFWLSYIDIEVEADVTSQKEEHKTNQDGEAKDFTMSAYILSFIDKAYGLSQANLHQLENELRSCLRCEHGVYYSSPIVTMMARHFQETRAEPLDSSHE